MSVKGPNAPPMVAHTDNDEGSDLHTHLHTSQLSSEDVAKFDLNVHEHSGQSKDHTISTPVKLKAMSSDIFTERNLNPTPMWLRSSLATPVVVSPAVSDLSQDSFEDEDRIWDTPLRDEKDGFAIDDINALTPLTPPSANQRANSSRYGEAESPLQHKTSRQIQMGFGEAPRFDPHTANDDYFSNLQPKIFRVETLLRTSK